MKKLLVFLCFWAGFACKKDKCDGLPAPFDNGKSLGQVAAHADLAELSGMAAAAKNLHGYWVHSDGGNAHTVFLIDSLGQLLGSNKLKNADNQDWEDLCAGPGPEPARRYLYLGDIGDNNENRTEIFVYRCPEPAAPNMDIENVEKIALRFPGGATNAETLMLDPLSKDIFIVTKEKRARVFRAKYPYSTSTANVLELVGETCIEKPTGGDISPDGSEVVVRNGPTLFYWKTGAGESIADVFARPTAETALLDEPQGEAICFNLAATGVLTSSERRGSGGQPIHFYKKK